MKKKDHKRKTNSNILNDIGFQRFMKTAGPDLDPVFMILKSHLLAEYYIDQFIALGIPRGDIILNKGFSFSQKLTILESLNIAEKNIIDSLGALNRLRNRCTHDMDYKISESDIDKIGFLQGKSYFNDKEYLGYDQKNLLHLTLIGIISPLDGLLRHFKKNHKKIGAKN